MRELLWMFVASIYFGTIFFLVFAAGRRAGIDETEERQHAAALEAEEAAHAVEARTRAAAERITARKIEPLPIVEIGPADFMRDEDTTDDETFMDPGELSQVIIQEAIDDVLRPPAVRGVQRGDLIEVDIEGVWVPCRAATSPIDVNGDHLIGVWGLEPNPAEMRSIDLHRVRRPRV